ncbi:MAG: hypothetical protein JSU95_09910, partial [Betaproteobacteria bacterium]
MSRLLDSIKQAERARRKKKKTVPAQIGEENYADAAPSVFNAQPAPTGEAQLDEPTPPGTVTLHIEAEKAIKDESDKDASTSLASGGDSAAPAEEAKARARIRISSHTSRIEQREAR